jgi:lysophospholipase L1-like esterase
MTLSLRLPAALIVAALSLLLELAPSRAVARVTPADASADVLVLGDSLAVGLRPSLPGLLGDTRIAWDARTGRTTPQGLTALRGALRIVHPKTVIVSLGTNDGPDGPRFASRIAKVLHDVGPSACVVWSDIYRPARKGPYAALNATLASEAKQVKRLHLVPWLAAVTAQKVTLPDGLHPDPAGFQYRARLIADAVHANCAAPVPTVGGSVGSGAPSAGGGTGGAAAPDA